MDIDKLKQEITRETLFATEQILNYVSVAIHPDRYPLLRGKILSLGNNTWRNLHEYINKETGEDDE